LKQLLREQVSFAGDLLWTVCELEFVDTYCAEAALQVRSSDAGTSGYALEILLRGARDDQYLGLALEVLEAAPMRVFEHAVFVLASQGVERAREVFRVGGWRWAADRVEDLHRELPDIEKLVETIAELVDDAGPERLFLGLMLAVLGSERDERAVQVLERVGPDRFHGISVQLRRMFERRWLAKI
jgi:hypothetical protein